MKRLNFITHLKRFFPMLVFAVCVAPVMGQSSNLNIKADPFGSTTSTFKLISPLDKQYEFSESTRDYFLPEELPPGAGSVREVLPGTDKFIGEAQENSTSSRFPAESTIQYTSFGSKTYILRSFTGKYVRWALPESWLGANGLSLQELKQLVDLTDMLYVHKLEIIGIEPIGQGVITIAVVDISAALGVVGGKGIEISSGLLSEVKKSLAAGLVSGYVNHEMSHNFDVFSYPRKYLSYYADWGHAWTDFLDPYTRFYSRTGSEELIADKFLIETISNYLRPWNAAGDRATWAKCVRDGGGCEADGISANNAWAGFVLRYISLHGSLAIKRAFAFLKEYSDKNSPVPQTAEEKNDLFVQALASGAGVNISCEVDTWRWQISHQLRTKLSETYLNDNPFCKDIDGDNFSPAKGDFDDRNSAVYPGAIEVVNGIDDNCNGYTDDIVFKEEADFNNQAPPIISPPIRLTGRASNSEDWDYFQLPSDKSKRLDIFFRSMGPFGGWVQLTEPWRSIVYISPGKFGYGSLSLNQGEKYLLAVIPQDNNTGDYEVFISDHGDKSNPVTLSVGPGQQGNSVRISAIADPTLFGNEQPTSIRFWADGIGFIKDIPYSQNTSFDWITPPEGGVVGLRAQLIAQDHPISAPSDSVFIQTVNQIKISIDDKTVTEGSSGTTNALFTVTLSQPSNQQITVDYSTTNDTATGGIDYQSVSGTLTFAPGETAKTITVLVNGDTVNEPNEIFFLNLTGAQNAAVARGQGGGTIINDDATSVQLNANNYSINEAESSGVVLVTVVRGGDLTTTFTVGYSTSDTSGVIPCQTNGNGIASDRCDYATSRGTLRFTAGEQAKTIQIPIINDSHLEPNETFTTSLSNAQGATLGTIVSATVNIQDNDTQQATTNPINGMEFFIKAQYIDFLGRVAEPGGLAFWMNRMNNCPPGDICDRTDTAKRFFESDEFKERGYFVFKLYDVMLGRLPLYTEFVPDVARLNGFQSVQEQQQNKAAYLADFMNKTEFRNLYGGYVNTNGTLIAGQAAAFVDALIAKAGITIPTATRTLLINNQQNGTRSPAQVLDDFILIPEISNVGTRFYDRAIITMQYFGFLRRNPDQGGFDYWWNRLANPQSQFYHNYREIVSNFITADEYYFRFSNVLYKP